MAIVQISMFAAVRAVSPRHRPRAESACGFHGRDPHGAGCRMLAAAGGAPNPGVLPVLRARAHRALTTVARAAAMLDLPVVR
jgi:hypothetical protein